MVLSVVSLDCIDGGDRVVDIFGCLAELMLLCFDRWTKVLGDEPQNDGDDWESGKHDKTQLPAEEESNANGGRCIEEFVNEKAQRLRDTEL